jgi:hypothetical protein
VGIPALASERWNGSYHGNRLRSGPGLRRVWAHDRVMIDSANEASLASLVGAAVIVDLNARIGAQTLDKPLAIKQRVEVRPKMAIHSTNRESDFPEDWLLGQDSNLEPFG